jgi:hypothetical protein
MMGFGFSGQDGDYNGNESGDLEGHDVLLD